MPESRSPGSRTRAVIVALLAALSLIETLACLITIPTEQLWPVKMVAREITPWFLAVNLVGVLIAWRWKISQAIFVVGVAVALWPVARDQGVAAGLQQQWREQGFDATILNVDGPVTLVQGAFRHVVLRDIEPEMLSPTIALYRPAVASTRLLPIVVDIHGGSWQHGGVREDDAFARLVAPLGYAVFTIDYRKAPQFTYPAQRDDVGGTIRWVHDNAARLGADATRIALVGRSAGGHLALLAAFQGVGIPIRSVISFYGPADMLALYNDPPVPDPLDVRDKARAFLGGSPSQVPDAYREASPITYARSDLPPTLLIQGASDNIVQARFTRGFHSRLRAAGATSLLLEIPWADHSFDFVYFGVSNQLAGSVVESFLTATLR